MALALLPDRPPVVGTLFALPLVLLLPGYALTQALFYPRPAGSSSGLSADTSGGLILPPRLRLTRQFDAIDHLAFSLGLSLVIDIVVGFILNLLPVGLQWQSWSLSLGLLTTAFALLAAVRRLKNGALLIKRDMIFKKGDRQSRPYDMIFQKGDRKGRPYKEGALLGAALVIGALAVWMSIVRPPQPQPSFTQFWMLPPAQASHSCAVRIGVQSFETGTVTYDIQVTSNGVQVSSWPSITLAAQQQWEHMVNISTTSGGGSSQLVDARLYRRDQPDTIYREVHVTLNSCG